MRTVSGVRVAGEHPQRRAVPHEYAMRGLDIQSCAIDGSIVRRGRIVRPFAAGIPVLPPGNGYVGSVCGQGNLRGRNRALCIVLE